MPAFNPNTVPVDFVILGGAATPGLGKVVGASSPRKWDQRQGYGLSGAYPVFLGFELSKFQLVLELYDDQDWEDWESFKPIVDKGPDGRRPRSLDIVHPYLAGLGIKSVVVLDVTQPDDQDTGYSVITIELMAFRRPKIALAKPEGSDDKNKLDPWQKKIEDLSAQNQKLADELAKQ